jgi:hypothetical protein
MIVAAALLAIAFGATGCGSAHAAVHKCSFYTRTDPNTQPPESCIASTGFSCSNYSTGAKPPDCLTAGQAAAQEKAAKRAAARAKAQRGMDQAIALVSNATGHSVTDITCTHDLDYFCKAGHRQGFDDPDQPLCWKVLTGPGRPVVLGPLSAYCP